MAWLYVAYSVTARGLSIFVYTRSHYFNTLLAKIILHTTQARYILYVVMWRTVVFVWRTVMFVWRTVMFVWRTVMFVWRTVVLGWCTVMLGWCTVVFVWRTVVFVWRTVVFVWRTSKIHCSVTGINIETFLVFRHTGCFYAYITLYMTHLYHAELKGNTIEIQFRCYM